MGKEQGKIPVPPKHASAGQYVFFLAQASPRLVSPTPVLCLWVVEFYNLDFCPQLCDTDESLVFPVSLDNSQTPFKCSHFGI